MNHVIDFVISFGSEGAQLGEEITHGKGLLQYKSHHPGQKIIDIGQMAGFQLQSTIFKYKAPYVMV